MTSDQMAMINDPGQAASTKPGYPQKLNGNCMQHPWSCIILSLIKDYNLGLLYVV